MDDTNIQSCTFCKHLNEVKQTDDYHIKNNKGRSGKTECHYRVSLVHETYYNGYYCGRVTYDTEPLNFCPVCGIKIEKEN